jgi:hypothetical protein
MQDLADEWHDAGPTKPHDSYKVLKSWEWLRLLFNAILIPWTVLLIAVLPGGGTGGPADVFVGGLVANVCFCLGPVGETYIVQTGASPQIVRRWLFALGTGLTAIAVILTLTL